MAADLWLGRDFTLRARAVGWSWLPYVAPPAHVETPEIAKERLDLNYRLNDDERRALRVMARKQAGHIALVAAQIADRIHRTPVWHNQFFAQHECRVDLGAEITYLTQTALTLAEHDRLLGPPPVGSRAEDLDVTGLYIEKAHLLDQRIDALLDRLEALNAYRTTVDQIQARATKQQWLDRMGTIDDVDAGAQAIADRLHADSVRDAAVASHARATAYLPNMEPLTARLTASLH